MRQRTQCDSQALTRTQQLTTPVHRPEPLTNSPTAATSGRQLPSSQTSEHTAEVCRAPHFLGLDAKPRLSYLTSTLPPLRGWGRNPKDHAPPVPLAECCGEGGGALCFRLILRPELRALQRCRDVTPGVSIHREEFLRSSAASWRLPGDKELLGGRGGYRVAVRQPASGGRDVYLPRGSGRC